MAATSDALAALTAVDLAEAIGSRRVSCEEVMRAALARIDRLNPGIDAIISRRPDDALLAEARAADADLARGRRRGPLHGFPHAVKDLAATRDVPTTKGSPLLADFVPAADAVHVERLRAAGAILVGKTNVPEFGLGSHSYNPVFGVTRNPYDLSRTAGGSSGGAAAALAARLVPLADGSDHAGSLRNPAAFNNVLGLRPSAGRVPDGTEEVFLPALTVVGPMARNVADLALLFSVQAGYDPRVPASIPGDGSEFAKVAPRDLRGARFGWIGDWGGHLPFEPGILDLCERALRLLEAEGATVEPVRPDFSPEEVWTTWLTLRRFLVGGALAAFHRDPEKRARMKPEARWEVERGLGTSALEVHAASVRRAAWYHVVRRLHERYDALVLPSAQVFPFPAEWTWPREVAGRAMDTYHRWMEVVIPGTLSGCPVLALPVGFDARGLPMGMQWIGPDRGEAGLLALAAAYERASGYDRAAPPEP